MTTNTIIFSDLSTYTVSSTIQFYESVFGWTFYEENGYYLAYKSNDIVAGLYETPEKFQQIQMPHFWMTYIKVDDIKNVVDKARSMSGIIELRQSVPSLGEVALIRDPQGAGFTVYQGDKLSSTRTANEVDTLIWNELHVSDATNVLPFYESIFDWKFTQKDNTCYEVFNSENEHLANILEIPNAYKGKYEYWVCTFGVKNVQKTAESVIQNGGSIVNDEEDRILVTDNSGEAFFYIQQIE